MIPLSTLKRYAPAFVFAAWAAATLLFGQHQVEPASAKAGWLLAIAMAIVIAENERARRRRESGRG